MYACMVIVNSMLTIIMIIAACTGDLLVMCMYQGRLSWEGAEGATAPPIMLLERQCPLKNNQSHDAVFYLNFVV